MADPVSTAVVGEIVKKLIDPIFRKFSYLFRYTSNIKSLEDGVQDLKKTKNDLSKRVKAGERNLKKVTETGNAWIENVNEEEKKAEQIRQGTEIVKDGCMKGWCPNLKLRYSLSRKAVKQIVIVKKLQKEGKTFTEEQLFDPPIPAGTVASSSATHLEKYESRISLTNKVIDTLNNESISKVGICGLPGIGKTTMAQEIRELKANNLFDEVAMAVVSQNPDLKEIQSQLASMLGLKLEEKNIVNVRAGKLRERLTQGNRRILVILDDLWDGLDLWELGIPVRSQGEPKGAKRCKVLITSRNDHVCNIMEAQIFSVEVLSKEEAWNLFKQKAGDCVETPEFGSVAEKVLNVCGRLPLAIIVVGSALKGRQKSVWKDALHQLKRFRVTNIRGIDEVYASLWLSYDYLDKRSSQKKNGRNQHQQLFLLCCIFPEDFNIPVEDLVRFSVGLRFLIDVEDLESARNRVLSLVDELKSFHLLEHSDEEGCVKMHDVVRCFGLDEASNGEHVVRHDAKLKEWPQSDAIKPAAISIRSEENLELPPGIDYPWLRLLLISARGSIDVSIDNFRGMKEVKVLAIYRQLVSFDAGTKLLEYQAEAPELFMNVRTLCLERCHFGIGVGLIGRMCNLEILSFNYSEEIDVLPSEIGQLKNLKLLDLCGLEVGLIESGVLSSLTKLEDLYMGNYFNKVGVEELNNGNCARVTELYSLSCLRSLQLSVSEAGLTMMLKDFPGERLTRFSFSMSEYYRYKQYNNFRNEVSLDGVELGKLSGSKFEALIKRAEVISLSSVSGWNNIVRESDRPCLINLEVLVIKKCKAIRSLFPSSVVKCLVQLQVLKIYDCKLLEEIIWEDGVEESEEITLPKLKNVRLESLPRLGSRIASSSHNCQSGSIFNKVLSPCMETLALESIGGAVKVFVNHEQIYSCSKLHEFQVYNCNAMEVLFDFQGVEIPNGEDGEEVKALDRLDTITIHHLHELRDIWKNVPKQGFHGFHNLTNLDVSDCRKLKYLLSISMAKLLVNLQVISVERCKLMEYVIMIEEEKVSPRCEIERVDKLVFPKLFEVNLQIVNNLKAFCQGSCDLEFPSLKKVSIYKCLNMKKILSSESTTPNFKEVILSSLENLTLNGMSAVKIVGEFQSALYSLRALNIYNFDSMETLFDFEGVDVTLDVQGEEVMVLGQLDAIKIEDLKELRDIWKNVPKQAGFQAFHKLTELDVSYCRNLRYLLSPCMAKLLVNLQVIKICGCDNMQYVIMTDTEELFDNEIVFPRLHELELRDLENLTAFCQGSYDLQFPLLKNVDIKSCGKMKRILCSESPAHNFKEEVLSPSLETLTLSYMILVGVEIQSGSLNNLRALNVDNCDSMETLFDFEGIDVISGEEVMVLGQLDAIYIEHLKELRDIWKNVPKQVGFQGSFHKLTVLDVSYCYELRYLISTCMAKHFVNLQVIKVEECAKMEEVIQRDDEEEKGSCGIKMNSIEFPCLRQIHLTHLWSLKAFHEGSCDFRFPLLDYLSINKCLKMNKFCSSSVNHPKLQHVQIEKDSSVPLMVDLNTTIKLHINKLEGRGKQRNQR